MRQNPYEKVKRAAFIVCLILAVCLTVSGIFMLAKKTHKNRKTAKSSTAVTESGTKIVPDSGTQTDELYFDENGQLQFKESDVDELIKEQESEEKEAPADRDVSPENDPAYSETVAPPQTDSADTNATEAQPQQEQQPDAGAQ